jgi:hypothetical protein
MKYNGEMAMWRNGAKWLMALALSWQQWQRISLAGNGVSASIMYQRIS